MAVRLQLLGSVGGIGMEGWKYDCIQLRVEALVVKRKG